MRIRTICTCILAAAMLLARPVSAQTDASALEAALHGKHLWAVQLLRGPGGEVYLRQWQTASLIPSSCMGWRAFTPDTVQKKGSKVLIEGQFASLGHCQGWFPSDGNTADAN